MPRKPPKSPNEWGPDNPPPKGGRPKGSRDRATIVREILEAVNRKTGKPMVDVMTEAVLRRAIKNGDAFAFDKLMDSAYGKIKDVQKLEVSGVGVERTIKDDVCDDPASDKPLPGEPGHPDTPAE